MKKHLTVNSLLKILVFIFALILFCPSFTFAQQAIKNINWDSWKFFEGEWIGEGTGQPGDGIGGFTLLPDLQDRILVRKNYADYPATENRTAFSHNDLMIIYQEEGMTKSIYFNNEGHIINYTVTFSEDSSRIIFLSNVNPTTPTFRLTYIKDSNDKLKILFEIAPSGKSDSFTKYIEASARRKL